MSDVPPPHDWHAPIIAGIVRAYGKYRPPVYVEIGLDRGETFNVVADWAAVAHGVDVTLEHLRFPGLHAKPSVALFEQSSDDYFKRYDDAELPGPDVVFIDGDHSAEQVERDVVNALRIVRRDGTIIVHDTYPLDSRWADSHCGDGWRVIQRLHQRAYVDVATIPLFPGLTIITQRQGTLANLFRASDTGRP